jgi:hypothetical protein
MARLSHQMTLRVAAHGSLVSERSLIPPPSDVKTTILKSLPHPRANNPAIRGSDRNATLRLKSQASALGRRAPRPDDRFDVLVANKVFVRRFMT